MACPAERAFHVCYVAAEPVDPAAHSRHAGVILSILIVRSDDTVQHTGDGLRIIVFVRNQAIRQFIMVGMAAWAAKAADQKVLFDAAFPPADPHTGIAVGQFPSTMGTWRCWGSIHHLKNIKTAIERQRVI